MTNVSNRFLGLVACLSLLLATSGCVWIFREIGVHEVERPAQAVVVESPVRVHLVSGRSVVFLHGTLIEPDQISAANGAGKLYDIDLRGLTDVMMVSMDSVAAVESLSNEYNVDKSVGVSLLATAGAVVGVPALAVAIFGSCPTIYSVEDGELVLDGESFPNSIVSLFEQRDVDRVRADASPEGVVELEIRNEALETHYINHLELLEVRHPGGAVALPAPDGGAYLLESFHTPLRAEDRSGRDVLPSIAVSDEHVFSTDPGRLAAAEPDDLMDYVDVTFPALEGDSVAVVLKLRNSLLNTVYFYDFMLAGQGARSLDWLGRDLESISYAIGLGDFYARYMGLRVQVLDGDAYREVGKVGEVGPIAWDRVAVPVPVIGRDSLHIRLYFVADAWRIDEVSLAADVRTTVPRRVPLDDIASSSHHGPSSPMDVATAPDDQYLITMPGTRFQARFDVGAEPDEGRRTYFLAAQGYYTEWIRRSWLEGVTVDSTFAPSETTLHAAMRRWQEVKPTFENEFETSKIPVR